MRRTSSTHMISSAGFSKPASRASPCATPGLSSIVSPCARSVNREEVVVQERVVVEKLISRRRARHLLQPVQRLLGETQHHVIDGAIVSCGCVQPHDIDRHGGAPGLRPQRVPLWLSRFARSTLSGLSQLVPVEWPNLLPIDFQHSMRQGRQWHPQWVIRLLGQVLNAVLDQRHQCCQLVGRRAPAGLEDRDDALAEQHRVIFHSAAPMPGGRRKNCTSALLRGILQ